MNWKTLLTGPVALAALMTVGNAVKPPVVDDTAYLLFARHISAHPFDPYGWELHWYREPEPAMAVLLPPVLPYWLALGIRVFGEQPTLLKLWLFPVCYLFTRSAWSLFARFAPGWERPGTTLATLGPAALPLVNFMLDIPVAALGLAAVTAFVRGCDDRSLGRVILAGLLAGLAMQTKYTALTLPAVFLTYALSRGRFLPALLASGIAAGVFGCWEGWLVGRYGVSHFAEQLRGEAAGDVWAKLDAKAALFRPLVAQLGGLTATWALIAGWGLAVGRRWLVIAAVMLGIGYGLVAVVPGADAVLLRNGETGTPRLDLPALVYLPAGYLVLAAVVLTMILSRRSPNGRFLSAWLLVELVGYFALTPFPASRRVVPVALPLGLLVARLVAVCPPPQWLVGFGVACGVGLLAIDTWDARVEPAGVDAAAALIGDPGRHAIWTQGHWGWQYAADRRGWRLVVPGMSRLTQGDLLVLPVEPDAVGFYRPYHGGAKVMPDADALKLVGEWVWQDWLAGQTVPNLYGGVYPVVGRDHPRLRVRVYRVVRDWTVTTAGTH